VSDPIFQLKQVSKVFDRDNLPVHALDHIDLDIARGAFLGIVGTSGAGKSTLLRLLNLLETPSAGQIHFNGRDLAQLDVKSQREYLSKVSTIFQHFNLFHGKTVLDNVAFPLAIRGVPLAERHARARELIEKVGLADREGHYPSQLSGGQKQRVGIARALITHPQVLLCDEATSALDSQTTQTILDLLIELKQQYGFTVILITHAWEVIRYACDAAVLIEHGRITEAGTLKEVIQREQSVLKDHLLPLNTDAAWQNGPNTLDLILEHPETQTDLLSKVANALSIDFSILSGRVENLGKTPIARFQVRFRPRHPETQVDVSQVRQWLTDQTITVNV
jgi:D-methionine transport system ATP-binding protein